MTSQPRPTQAEPHATAREFPTSEAFVPNPTPATAHDATRDNDRRPPTKEPPPPAADAPPTPRPTADAPVADTLFDITPDPTARRRDIVAEQALKHLQSADHPLSTPTLATRIGGGLLPRILNTRLARDDRFTRSDIDTWALTEWGLRPYTSAHDLIVEELDKAGGPMPLHDLERVLTRDFSLQPATIRTAAATPPLTTRNGLVHHLDPPTDPPQPRTPPPRDPPPPGTLTREILDLMGLA
ncbi:hypothetical protein [Embleya scabrispora]|uniref:hypothetical protein n=1 Tax=Embleya scabrispora TaxID=159449 RepID=UPI000477864D|nr:hypothetical protein [Embleya scabrispora]MYS87879.1 hypothetical protein [Streptomyces sp. SID5474]